jgi:hypothetical protein
MNISVGVGVDLEQLQQAVNEPGEPQEATAEPEPQEAPVEPACPLPKRKRARVTGGRFAADDPSTAANEAWSES